MSEEKKIRKLNTKDAPLMLEWMRDQSEAHYLRKDFANKTLDDCLEFIAEGQDETVNIHMAITDDVDEYMGTVSLKNIQSDTAEFGIAIRTCAMGKGFALFGMKELLRYGLEKRGINEVYWCTDPENKRAVRFFEKNCFKHSLVPEQAAEYYTEEEMDKYLWYTVRVSEEMPELIADAERSQYELTVIISNYNQEKHIAETIDSVFAQKVNFPFKVIITDDCSTLDCSKEIIQDYAEKHNNIETIFATENGGYLRNILRAQERANTKYFCLLDADDYWTDSSYLQIAHDFLEKHDDYSIYEANVEAIAEDSDTGKPFVSSKFHTGTYDKEMFLSNKPIPITQTTGMFLRNCVYNNGIPQIMQNSISTRSERSFEGDTGRFIMHLKEGLAYYDDQIVGVYRLTKDGIWNRLSSSQKKIIKARMQLDYYRYYGSNVSFFANKAYQSLQEYLIEKQREVKDLRREAAFDDENERLMAEDVYQFCREHEIEIIKEDSVIEKLKRVYKILRS